MMPDASMIKPIKSPISFSLLYMGSPALQIIQPQNWKSLSTIFKGLVKIATEKIFAAIGLGLQGKGA
jgi:hypothetical protein